MTLKHSCYYGKKVAQGEYYENKYLAAKALKMPPLGSLLGTVA